MDEYIKREEIRRAYEKLSRSYMHGEPYIADWKFDEMIEELHAADVEPAQEWISVDEKLPQNFISVLGYRTDAGEFPPVRECYTVGNVFFFPALGDIHPVSHWCEMLQPPKGE